MLCDQTQRCDTIASSTWNFVKLAVPNVIANGCMWMIYPVNAYFAGQLKDEAKLAGIGLAQTTLYTFMWAFMIGFTIPTSTFTSQAFGKGDLRLCGIILNRGRFIVTTFFCPMAVLLLFSRKILLALGQDAIVVEHAVKYIKLVLPAYYMYTMFHLSRRWLNSMRLNYVPMTVMVVGIPINIACNHLFVNVWKMDIEGIACAFTCTCFSLLFLITVYTYCIPSISQALFLPTSETW